MDNGIRLQFVPGHPAMSFTMPVVSNHDGEIRCIGTAFLVAPGLAITAQHVVADWKYRQEQRDGYKRADATVSVTAYQLFNGAIYPWAVESSNASDADDIAFLSLYKPDWYGTGRGQVIPPVARLSFNPPNVGDEVRSFGFPDSAIEDHVLVIHPSESLGRVVRVDMTTDITSRAFSHFDAEVDVPFGMSGGPCLDKEGNVIGVNSRGWELAEGPPLAHIALLWAAMRVEIDLFKKGRFPAIKLFRDGPNRALGYRRVYITSKGHARLAKVDPDSLTAIPPHGLVKHFLGALHFADANAQECLAKARALLETPARGDVPLDANGLHKTLRHYFWELESTLTHAIELAKQRLNLTVDESTGWSGFITEWKGRTPAGPVLDELAQLDFLYNGIDMFELRTYAFLCRASPLHLQVVRGEDGQIIASCIQASRLGGGQLFLPDGLDRFIGASRRFVQRLLAAVDNAAPAGNDETSTN